MGKGRGLSPEVISAHPLWMKTVTFKSIDTYLINEADVFLDDLQSKHGISLPLVLLIGLSVLMALFVLYAIVAAALLGLTIWTVGMFAFGTFFIGLGWKRLASRYLADIRGDWTEAKTRKYAGAAVYNREKLAFLRMAAICLTPPMMVCGLLLGGEYAVMVPIMLTLLANMYFACAFPRAPTRRTEYRLAPSPAVG